MDTFLEPVRRARALIRSEPVWVRDYFKNALRVDAPSDGAKPVPDPIDLINAMMAERGLSRRDLLPVFGQRSHASEVLSRRRKLSLPMIRALVAHYGLPADRMIQDYQLLKGDA